MERGDFISGEAYCWYKFERESKNEEIQRLQRKVERANRDLRNRIVFELIVVTIYLVIDIANLVGLI